MSIVFNFKFLFLILKRGYFDLIMCPSYCTITRILKYSPAECFPLGAVVLEADVARKMMNSSLRHSYPVFFPKLEVELLLYVLGHPGK